MWDKIKQFFASPTFEGDEDKTRSAVLLKGILITLFITSVLGSLLMLWVEPEEFEFNLIFGIVVSMAILGLGRLLKQGRTRLLSWLLVVLLWLSLTSLMAFSGGIRSLALTGYYLVLVMAGALLGPNPAFLIGASNIVVGVALYIAELAGWIATRQAGTVAIEDILAYVMIMALTTFVLQVALRDINRWVKRTEASERELAERNLELYAHREELEAYTRDVERRFAYLQATARVAQEAASILEPSDLLTQIVTLISEYFGFDHVAIYMLDVARSWAVLQAASSEGGQRMLDRGHRLNLIEVLKVGEAVRSGSPQICRDLEVDAAFLANPDLPNMRSTVILPLRQTQDGVIMGILDIGSVETEAFGEQDAIVLQSLADQIAMVISNARLLAELQRSLAAAERASGEATRESWRQWLRAVPMRGYRYEAGETVPLTEENALQSPLSSEDDENLAELVLPLQVRGQALGRLVAHKSLAKGSWTQEENTILETLMAQLEQALDSARLYEVTRRRAIREQARREITDSIRAALSIEDAVRRAVQEMARVLGASEMVARIGTENLLLDKEADSDE